MKTMRVLVIDDDPQVLALLGRAFGALGLETVQARAGAEGLAVFRASAEQGSAFPLVITDLEMPGPSGLEVASEIAAVDPSTAIVLHTGRDPPSLGVVALPPAIDLVLSKPAKLDDLRLVIARFLDPHDPEGRPRACKR